MRFRKDFWKIPFLILENQEGGGGILTSLHTSIVPNTTWSPSKKLSPTMITVEPPDVHPSLGDIALMHGVATGSGG